MKRIVIFGPPGCGKSTIVNLLLKKKYSAVDVEALGTSYKERINKFLEKVKQEKNLTFYGAADLRLEDLPKGTLTVLICPSNLKLYKRRYKNRNSGKPYKKDQNEEKVYEWFYGNRNIFDVYIDNQTTPEKTLQMLLENSLKNKPRSE